MPCDERLELALTLTAGESSVTLPGGAVERFECRLEPWGATGELHLRTSPEERDDTLLPLVTSPALLTLKVSFRTRRDEPVGTAAEWMHVRALITARRLRETSAPSVTGQPIIARRYALHFEDAARALWRQHHPCEVRTDATLRSVIEANRPAAVPLTFDWRVLEEERPLVCLALGGVEGEHAPRASFYDWLLWLVHGGGGHFTWDAAEGGYRLGGAPERVTAAPSALAPADVAVMRWEPRDAPRSTAHVLNVSATANGDRAVAHPLAVTGVRRDLVGRTPLAAELDGQVERLRTAQRAPAPLLHLECARLPGVDVTPGRHVTFPEDAFGRGLLATGKRFRVQSLHLSAARIGLDSGLDGGLDDGLEDAHAPFRLDAQLALVAASDATPSLPTFTVPRWPLYAEGRVVSVGGGDDDRTWLPLEDAATSITRQRVELPLWNVKVPVPFEPGPFSGHVFFPSYKHARVRVEVGFGEARVARFLDWAEDVRPPADSQGNRIVWGKRAADGTVLEQLFVDAKPALTLARKAGDDEQTLEALEGILRMTVLEQPSTSVELPTYDVTLEVEAARGRLVMQVKGDIAGLSGKLEVAQAGAVGALETAVEDLSAAVSDMESQLGARIDAAKDEVEATLEALSSVADALGAAVAAAKAELLAELES